MPALASGAVHAGLLAVVLVLGNDGRPHRACRTKTGRPHPAGVRGDAGSWRRRWRRRPSPARSARPRGTEGTKQAGEPGCRREGGETRSGRARRNAAASPTGTQAGTEADSAATATTAGPCAARGRAGGQRAGRCDRPRWRSRGNAGDDPQQRTRLRRWNGNRNRHGRRARQRGGHRRRIDRRHRWRTVPCRVRGSRRRH